MKPNPQKRIRVIIADDHSVVRAGIRQYLEKAGDILVIAEAENGKEACNLIEKHRPDVAVLDIQMPEMSGIQAALWIRTNILETGVLILTAYDDDPYVLAVLRAGANGFILKTSRPEEICQAVRDVSEGKSVLDKTILPKVMTHLAHQKTSAPVEELTDREMEILKLIARGYTNKAAAVQLGISDRTVQGHLAHIFNKLNASSRTEAVMRAVSLGWLPPNLHELEKGTN
jgi:DNA-binding NarL/FixJ family response regulator